MKRVILPAAVATVFSVTSVNALAENNWKDSANDAWIDGKAETVLLLNGNLNSFSIDTDVKDSKVVLSGEVETDVDKSLAGELVQSIEGVEGVENNLSVKQKDSGKKEFTDTLKDAKIATVVKTRLLMESEVSGTDINVDVKKGTVTLKGKVKSDAERDLAIQIAKNTKDTRKVVDEIRVQ